MRPVLQYLLNLDRAWQHDELVQGSVAKLSVYLFGSGALLVALNNLGLHLLGAASLYRSIADPLLVLILGACTYMFCRRSKNHLLSNALPLWLAILSLGVHFQGALFDGLFLTSGQGPRYGLAAAMAMYAPLYYMAALVLVGGWQALAAALCFTVLSLAQTLVVLLTAKGISPATQYAAFAFVCAQPFYMVSLCCITMLRDSILSQHSEQVNSRKELLSMMAHEIRTPLQTIVYSIHLLNPHLTSDKGRKPLANISGSAARLNTYLQDVITYNKIDLRWDQLRREPFNLHELINELVEQFRPLAQAKGLELQAHTSQQLQFVVGDAVRIKQVLSNLVSNAIKYTQQGSVKISVQVHPNTATRVDFVVEDTGMGISAEMIPRIWAPFVRTEQALNSEIDGSGLGLAVVKDLVKLMHGEVSVASELGRGSTFTVTLALRI